MKGKTTSSSQLMQKKRLLKFNTLMIKTPRAQTETVSAGLVYCTGSAQHVSPASSTLLVRNWDASSELRSSASTLSPLLPSAALEALPEQLGVKKTKRRHCWKGSSSKVEGYKISAKKCIVVFYTLTTNKSRKEVKKISFMVKTRIKYLEINWSGEKPG